MKRHPLPGVELRIGDPSITAPLREDRSKPGHVVVVFTADRTQLDNVTLRVFVPAPLGGTVYELQIKNFVEER